jgi:hypothetical protein
MPQIDQPVTPAPKAPPETPKSKTAAPEKAPPAVYSFTIDTADGRIVMVESVDGDGSRHALTAEEKAKFAKSHPATPLRRLVEQAFEAGIEFVLGDEAGSDTPESKEDGAISGLLIQTMIEGSKAKALIKSETLDRAVIETLIGHAAK